MKIPLRKPPEKFYKDLDIKWESSTIGSLKDVFDMLDSGLDEGEGPPTENYYYNDQMKSSAIVIMIGVLATLVFVAAFNAKRCCKCARRYEERARHRRRVRDNEPDAGSKRLQPPPYHIALNMPKPVYDPDKFTNLSNLEHGLLTPSGLAVATTMASSQEPDSESQPSQQQLSDNNSSTPSPEGHSNPSFQPDSETSETPLNAQSLMVPPPTYSEALVIMEQRERSQSQRLRAESLQSQRVRADSVQTSVEADVYTH